MKLFHINVANKLNFLTKDKLIEEGKKLRTELKVKNELLLN